MKPTEFDLLMAKFFAAEASPEEQKRLLHWRESSTENEALFAQSKLLWEQSHDADWEPNTQAAWERVKKRTKPTATVLSLRGKQWLQLAAAMLIVSGLLAILIKLYNPTVTVSTAANEVKTITLPDGSRVTLNSSSTLAYGKNLSGKKRKVTLSGEAYFEVTKNPEQPFVVESEQALVEVLGTAFNLQAKPKLKTAILNVTEGKVQLKSTGSGAQGIVIAGQKAAIDSTGKLTPIVSIATNDMAWKNGELVFNNTSMKEVCAALENYFDITILVDDPTINNCHLTATFKKPKLNKVLSIICQSLQLKYQEQDQTILISGKGCKQ